MVTHGMESDWRQDMLVGNRLVIAVYGDELFAEEVTIKNIADYKGKDMKFFDRQGNPISKDKAVVLLTDYIKEIDREFREEAAKEGFDGREENGRFSRSNISSSKMINSGEEVYLLYIICGTMEKAAAALGVHRDTISKRIKRYREYLEK